MERKLDFGHGISASGRTEHLICFYIFAWHWRFGRPAKAPRLRYGGGPRYPWLFTRKRECTDAICFCLLADGIHHSTARTCARIRGSAAYDLGYLVEICLLILSPCLHAPRLHTSSTRCSTEQLESMLYFRPTSNRNAHGRCGVDSGIPSTDAILSAVSVRVFKAVCI